MTLSTQLNTNKDLTHFSENEVQLIKNYLCKEIDDYELKFFSDICKKTGLDPFTKQIYAIKRKGQLTIQTSIDGYRLIAERTGNYCPGREPTFTYDENRNLISATAYVKKKTSDGHWHEIAATAFLDEYKPEPYISKDGKSYENKFWLTKKHIMLSKCAEALALRKAFPSNLSQLYTKEEMDQAYKEEVEQTDIPILITDEQYEELNNLIMQCSTEFQDKITDMLLKSKIHSVQLLPAERYNGFKNYILSQINIEKSQNVEINA